MNEKCCNSVTVCAWIIKGSHGSVFIYLCVSNWEDEHAISLDKLTVRNKLNYIIIGTIDMLINVEIRSPNLSNPKNYQI